MIPRMTTVGNLKNYRYDLNRSGWNMNTAMNKVNTQRNFTSYAEDPAAAARCFQLRRSYLRTSSQLTLNDAVYSKYQQAWKSLDGVSKMIDTVKPDTGFTSILEALSDSTASGRNALGQSMVSKADSIIQSMNGRYGENFVFSGADTLTVPFTWTPTKNPNYIDPATADPANPDHASAFKYYAFADPTANPLDPTDLVGTNDISDLSKVVQDPVLNPARSDPDYDTTLVPGAAGYEGEYLSADGSGSTDDLSQAKWAPRENPDYDETTSMQYLKADGTPTSKESEAGRSLRYRGVLVDENDNAKMDYFLYDEKKYMDLGLGFQEKDGEIVPSSVFDTSLQGVYYLGGTGTSPETVEVNGQKMTFDDIPNNIVSVINEFGEILLRCDPNSGDWASDEDRYRAQALAQRFEDSASLTKQRYDELDAQSGFLKDNSELLTGNAQTLNEQFLALEDIDPAAAISQFMYAKYCYDTALKVGNSILSQSLMDYMSL